MLLGKTLADRNSITDEYIILSRPIPIPALAVDLLLVPGSLNVSSEDPKHSEE
jgi:hypothetical protein